jgi:hypothetical protein
MIPELTKPQDKLQAVLHYGWDDTDRDLPVEYLQACAEWFAGLSLRDRAIADSAVWVYASGDEVIAEKTATEPRRPTRAA